MERADLLTEQRNRRSRERIIEDQSKESEQSTSNLQDSENGSSKLVLEVKPSDSSTASTPENPSAKTLQEDQIISLDHIVQTSIELDEVAMKKIELLLALGSRRLAQDFKELLEEAFRAVDQNANLLRILRHKMGTSRDE